MQQKNITNENFAQNLRALMDREGITQESLSQDLGIAQSAVSNYLNGRAPRAEILFKISNYFAVPVHVLLGHQSQVVESLDHKEQIELRVHLDLLAVMVRELRDSYNATEQRIEAVEAELTTVRKLYGDFLRNRPK